MRPRCRYWMNRITRHKASPKNWLFSQSQAGVETSAAIYSIIETAKRSDHEPWHYLNHVLTRLPTTKPGGLQNLLPHNMPAITFTQTWLGGEIERLLHNAFLTEDTNYENELFWWHRYFVQGGRVLGALFLTWSSNFYRLIHDFLKRQYSIVKIFFPIGKSAISIGLY